MPPPKKKAKTGNINNIRSNEDIRQAIDTWCEKQEECIKIYGHISRWNTSKVTDMNRLFYQKEDFNDDISNWDVSNVTTMEGMFKEARSFNQPIGNWDVSKVKSMECMFKYASSFNQSIGSWNVRNVTRMQYMFWEAAEFAYKNEVALWNLTNEDCDY